MFEWLRKLKRKARPTFIVPRYNIQEVHMTDSVAINEGKAVAKKDLRKVVKPKDVVNQLYDKERLIDLRDLDSKIKAVKKRKDFIRDDLGLCDYSQEDQAIKWLEARKGFEKNKSLFYWKMTTRTAIDKLLEKYKLRRVGLSGYVRNVPTEALEEVDAYLKAVGKVQKIKPTFELVIDDDEYKKDPILLSKSPFGNYYYVLGAWDKEVEIVDELFK